MSRTLDRHYQLHLIAFSFLLSALGSYVGLLAIKRRSSRYGLRNWIRLAGGSLLLAAVAAWSPVFVVVNGLHVDGGLKIYFTPLIYLALLVCWLCCALGAFIAVDPDAPVHPFYHFAGGAVIGAGHFAMLRLIFASVRLQASVEWNTGVAVLGLLLAVVLPSLSLFWFFARLNTWTVKWWRHALASGLLSGSLFVVNMTVQSAAVLKESDDVPSTDGTEEVRDLNLIIAPMLFGTSVAFVATTLVIQVRQRKLRDLLNSLHLSIVFSDGHGRVLTTKSHWLPSTRITDLYEGASTFTDTNEDFLRMLQTSFQWSQRGREVQTLDGHVRNGRVAHSSLELYKHFVEAAEKLAEQLDINVTRLGVVYPHPFRVLRGSQRGYMVLVTKIVSPEVARLLSSRGTLKWITVGRFATRFYETYVPVQVGTWEEAVLELSRPRHRRGSNDSGSDEDDEHEEERPRSRVSNHRPHSARSMYKHSFQRRPDLEGSGSKLLLQRGLPEIFEFAASVERVLEPGIYVGLCLTRTSALALDVMVPRAWRNTIPMVRISSKSGVRKEDLEAIVDLGRARTPVSRKDRLSAIMRGGSSPEVPNSPVAKFKKLENDEFTPRVEEYVNLFEREVRRLRGDVYPLDTIVRRLRMTPLLQYRVRRGVPYGKCVDPESLVDWLISQGDADNEERALAIGQRLLDATLISFVTGGGPEDAFVLGKDNLYSVAVPYEYDPDIANSGDSFQERFVAGVAALARSLGTAEHLTLANLVRDDGSGQCSTADSRSGSSSSRSSLLHAQHESIPPLVVDIGSLDGDRSAQMLIFYVSLFSPRFPERYRVDRFVMYALAEFEMFHSRLSVEDAIVEGDEDVEESKSTEGQDDDDDEADEAKEEEPQEFQLHIGSSVEVRGDETCSGDGAKEEEETEENQRDSLEVPPRRQSSDSTSQSYSQSRSRRASLSGSAQPNRSQSDSGSVVIRSNSTVFLSSHSEDATSARRGSVAYAAEAKDLQEEIASRSIGPVCWIRSVIQLRSLQRSVGGSGSMSSSRLQPPSSSHEQQQREMSKPKRASSASSASLRRATEQAAFRLKEAARRSSVETLRRNSVEAMRRYDSNGDASVAVDVAPEAEDGVQDKSGPPGEIELPRVE